MSNVFLKLCIKGTVSLRRMEKVSFLFIITLQTMPDKTNELYGYSVCGFKYIFNMGNRFS